MKSRRIKLPSFLCLVALLAALAAIGIACGGEATTAPEPTQQPPPTQAMMAPTPVPVDLTAITAEMQKSISDAIAGIESPETLSEGEIQKLVQDAVAQAAASAVANVAASVPEPLSDAEVAALVEAAVAQAAASAPEPVSEAEIAAIVMAAIPTPVPTPTAMSPVAMRAEPVSERVIIAAFTEEEGNDPGLVVSAFWGQLTPMYETLVQYDQYGQYAPMLATSWEVNEDFTQWTFDLRKDVPFHFGFGEFDAKDIVHSIERNYREGTLEANAPFYNGVDFEVVDDYRIVWNLPENKSSPRWFSNELATFVTSKVHFEAEGDEYLRERPAGTGPYQFKERREGEYVLFERVPHDHWRVIGDFPEIQLLNVPESGTRLAMLLTNEAHIGQVETRNQSQATSRGLEVITSTIPSNPVYDMFGGSYLEDSPDYDPTLPWATHGERGRKVREAMNRAINRHELQETILGGRGDPMAVTFYHPSLPGWDQSWIDNFEENYGYDPERAKELLAEAGYPDGFDVEILMVPRLELTEALDVSEAIGNYWKEIGLDVTLNPQEVVYFVDRFLAHDMDFIWLDATRRFQDPSMLRVIYTTGPPLHFFVRPELDAIYEELELKPTTDLGERDRLLREAGQFIYDEYGTVPLWWLRMELVINPEVVSAFKFSGFLYPWDLEYIKAVKK